MGAVETMEEFFEKLNAGDRQGAVDLMDEKTEMRVHVGDNVQTLRGVERVGGWFLRGDAGLRMIPGEIRDTGNTYEADVLVVRPGAPTQHIDATFRVEAGRITAINIAPSTPRYGTRHVPYVLPGLQTQVEPVRARLFAAGSVPDMHEMPADGRPPRRPGACFCSLRSTTRRRG